LHAKLKMEAIRWAVSMSEVASIALAQFLLGEEVPVEKPESSAPEPFVGRFGGEHQTPKVEGKASEPEPQVGPLTYEVE